MSESLVLVEIDGPLSILTLNRPAVLNSFTPELLGELLAGLRQAVDGGSRAIMVTGAGRGFCAGQDLASIQDQYATGGPDLAKLLREHFHPVFRFIRESPVPVMAAVNGVAAGAGFSLALACDMRIASSAARFATAFLKIGLVPDAGMAYTLPRLISTAKASALMLSGDQVDAPTALSLGIVDRVVDAGTFGPTARAIALELANGPTAAYGLTKRLLQQAEHASFDELLELEADAQGAAGYTADHAAAVSAFLEKRPPVFGGR